MMDRNLNSEAARAVADAIQKAVSLLQRKSKSAQTTDPNSPQPTQSAAGVLVFIGDLLANSALAKLFASSDPKAAALSGSLIGLASGVDAVTDEKNKPTPEAGNQPLRSVLTICAYVIGGIAAAMIYRGIRRNTQPNPI